MPAPKTLYLILIVALFYSFSSLAQITTDEAPKVAAIGDQFYCPLSEINVVTDFRISGPDNPEIDAFFIQITSGYLRGDLLKLTGSSTGLNDIWDPITGKLTLSKSGDLLSYEEINEAVKNVVYIGDDPQFSGEKFFSFTLGSANYLPSTGHFYEFVSAPNIRWDDAKTRAESMTYFGLQGYLATITSSEEAILSGEQATGTGWIGASDAETEGTWKWVTGPEEGTVFWIGDYINGYAPNGAYENWNNNEPNNLNDEDYGHVITNPAIGRRGTWNDLPIAGGGGDFAAQGFVVEYGYGGPDDAPDFSAFTRVYTSAIDSVFEGSSCGPGQVLLRAKAIEIDTIPEPAMIHWFETETATTPIHTGETYSPVLDVTTNFYILATDDNCFEGNRTIITASIFEIPDIEKEVTLKNCDADDDPTNGFTDFNLEEANDLINKGDLSLVISYYLTASDANQAVNPLIPFPFNNQTASSVYARAENADGCFDISRVYLEVSATRPVELVTLASCDLDDLNDGKFAFDLTQATDQILIQLPPQNLVVQYYRNLNDASLEQNAIVPQTAYENEEAFNQLLYVRVESEDNGDCISLGEFVELVVYPLPEFDVTPEAVYCINLEPISISVENPDGNYSYEWRNASGDIISFESSVNISSGGTYTVTGTSEINCQSLPRTIQVFESSNATISQEDIKVDDGEELNTITISTENLGPGDYEFALDGGSYQQEPYFDNVAPGIHFLSVRDINGCGISRIQVSVIGFPKFFTPNGDGYNDTWQVLGILSQPMSNIYVYDKFGKLLTEIDPRGDGWDGIYNGKQLPSSDYWYMVQLEDGRVYRGHFSLIRR
jgi:gliding motility-associated-like protein